MTRRWLSYGEMWRGDAVELNTDSPKIPVDGDMAYAADGKVTFSLILSGATWDELVRLWSRIENYLTRAPQGASPYRAGRGVVLIEQEHDSSEWTYRDVRSGTMTPIQQSKLHPLTNVTRANLTLECEPLARSTPILTDFGATRTNADAGLHLTGTPGTAEALLEVRIRDVGGRIAAVHLGQRSDKYLFDADNPSSQALAGALTTSDSWQRLAQATITGRGRYDVLASVNDAGLVMTPPRFSTVRNIPGGGSLQPGSTLAAVVTPYDANHHYGPPSRFATLSTPPLLVGAEQTPVKYLVFEDLAGGQFQTLMPGPLGFGVQVGSAFAPPGADYGVRVPAGSMVAAGAPDWPDSKILSWQAWIRPYQAGFGIGVRYNRGTKDTTTTTRTQTHGTGSNSADNTADQDGHSASSTVTDSSQSGGSSSDSSTSTPTQTSHSHTHTVGQADTPTQSSHSHSRTSNTEDPSNSQTSVTTTDTLSSSVTGSHSHNVESSASTNENDSTPDAAGGTRTASSNSGFSDNTSTSESPPGGLGSNQSHSQTTTTTTGGAPNKDSDTTTDTDGHSSATSDNDSTSDTDGHSESKSHTEGATGGTSHSESNTQTPETTSHSHSVTAASSVNDGDTTTTTTTLTADTVPVQGGLYLSGGNGYVATMDPATGLAQVSDAVALDPSAFHLAEVTVMQTAAGAVFRVALDRVVLGGWEEDNGVTLADFMVSGVDAGIFTLATAYIGGGVIAGGSGDDYAWEPSRNAAGYLFSFQEGDNPFRSIDLGSATSYTHVSPIPADSFLGDPPAGPLYSDYARLRVSLGGGATETRLLPQKVARTAVAGSVDELVSLGRFALPPGGRAEGGNEAEQTRLVIDAQMGGAIATPALTIAQLWFLPCDQRDSLQQITVSASGLGGVGYEWRIGTDRWGRSYARLYDLNTGAFVAFADVTGGIGCGPGETILTVVCEAEGDLGAFSPDLTLNYTLATQRTPRWKWAAVPAGGF